eukprot:148175-Chlamydomonas_euryale.AAC.1
MRTGGRIGSSSPEIPGRIKKHAWYRLHIRQHATYGTRQTCIADNFSLLDAAPRPSCTRERCGEVC